MAIKSSGGIHLQNRRLKMLKAVPGVKVILITGFPPLLKAHLSPSFGHPSTSTF